MEEMKKSESKTGQSSKVTLETMNKVQNEHDRVLNVHESAGHDSKSKHSQEIESQSNNLTKSALRVDKYTVQSDESKSSQHIASDSNTISENQFDEINERKKSGSKDKIKNEQKGEICAKVFYRSLKKIVQGTKKYENINKDKTDNLRNEENLKTGVKENAGEKSAGNVTKIGQDDIPDNVKKKVKKYGVPEKVQERNIKYLDDEKLEDKEKNEQIKYVTEKVQHFKITDVEDTEEMLDTARVHEIIKREEENADGLKELKGDEKFEEFDKSFQQDDVTEEILGKVDDEFEKVQKNRNWVKEVDESVEKSKDINVLGEKFKDYEKKDKQVKVPEEKLSKINVLEEFEQGQAKLNGLKAEEKITQDKDKIPPVEEIKQFGEKLIRVREVQESLEQVKDQIETVNQIKKFEDNDQRVKVDGKIFDDVVHVHENDEQVQEKLDGVQEIEESVEQVKDKSEHLDQIKEFGEKDQHVEVSEQKLDMVKVHDEFYKIQVKIDEAKEVEEELKQIKSLKETKKFQEKVQQVKDADKIIEKVHEEIKEVEVKQDGDKDEKSVEQVKVKNELLNKEFEKKDQHVEFAEEKLDIVKVHDEFEQLQIKQEGAKEVGERVKQGKSVEATKVWEEKVKQLKDADKIIEKMHEEFKEVEVKLDDKEVEESVNQVKDKNELLNQEFEKKDHDVEVADEKLNIVKVHDKFEQLQVKLDEAKEVKEKVKQGKSVEETKEFKEKVQKLKDADKIIEKVHDEFKEVEERHKKATQFKDRFKKPVEQIKEYEEKVIDKFNQVTETLDDVKEVEKRYEPVKDIIKPLERLNEIVKNAEKVKKAEEIYDQAELHEKIEQVLKKLDGVKVDDKDKYRVEERVLDNEEKVPEKLNKGEDNVVDQLKEQERLEVKAETSEVLLDKKVKEMVEAIVKKRVEEKIQEKVAEVREEVEERVKEMVQKIIVKEVEEKDNRKYGLKKKNQILIFLKNAKEKMKKTRKLVHQTVGLKNMSKDTFSDTENHEKKGAKFLCFIRKVIENTKKSKETIKKKMGIKQELCDKVKDEELKEYGKILKQEFQEKYVRQKKGFEEKEDFTEHKESQEVRVKDVNIENSEKIIDGSEEKIVTEKEDNVAKTGKRIDEIKVKVKQFEYQVDDRDEKLKEEVDTEDNVKDEVKLKQEGFKCANKFLSNFKMFIEKTKRTKKVMREKLGMKYDKVGDEQALNGEYKERDYVNVTDVENIKIKDTDEVKVQEGRVEERGKLVQDIKEKAKKLEHQVEGKDEKLQQEVDTKRSLKNQLKHKLKGVMFRNKLLSSFQRVMEKTKQIKKKTEEKSGIEFVNIKDEKGENISNVKIKVAGENDEEDEENMKTKEANKVIIQKNYENKLDQDKEKKGVVSEDELKQQPKGLACANNILNSLKKFTSKTKKLKEIIRRNVKVHTINDKNEIELSKDRVETEFGSEVNVKKLNLEGDKMYKTVEDQVEKPDGLKVQLKLKGSKCASNFFKCSKIIRDTKKTICGKFVKKMRLKGTINDTQKYDEMSEIVKKKVQEELKGKVKEVKLEFEDKVKEMVEKIVKKQVEENLNKVCKESGKKKAQGIVKNEEVEKIVKGIMKRVEKKVVEKNEDAILVNHREFLEKGKQIVVNEHTYKELVKGSVREPNEEKVEEIIKEVHGKVEEKRKECYDIVNKIKDEVFQRFLQSMEKVKGKGEKSYEKVKGIEQKHTEKVEKIVEEVKDDLLQRFLQSIEKVQVKPKNSEVVQIKEDLRKDEKLAKQVEAEGFQRLLQGFDKVKAEFEEKIKEGSENKEFLEVRGKPSGHVEEEFEDKYKAKVAEKTKVEIKNVGESVKGVDHKREVKKIVEEVFQRFLQGFEERKAGGKEIEGEVKEFQIRGERPRHEIKGEVENKYKIAKETQPDYTTKAEEIVTKVKDEVFERFLQTVEEEDKVVKEVGHKDEAKVGSIIKEVTDEVFQRFLHSVHIVKADLEEKIKQGNKGNAEKIEKLEEKPYNEIIRGIQEEKGKKYDEEATKEGKIAKGTEEIVKEVRDELFQRFIQSLEKLKGERKRKDVELKRIKENAKDKAEDEGEIKEYMVEEVKDEIFQRFLQTVEEVETGVEKMLKEERDIEELANGQVKSYNNNDSEIKEEVGELREKYKEEAKSLEGEIKEVKELIKEVKDDVFQRFIQSVRKKEEERAGKNKEYKEEIKNEIVKVIKDEILQRFLQVLKNDEAGVGKKVNEGNVEKLEELKEKLYEIVSRDTDEANGEHREKVKRIEAKQNEIQEIVNEVKDEVLQRLIHSEEKLEKRIASKVAEFTEVKENDKVKEKPKGEMKEITEIVTELKKEVFKRFVQSVENIEAEVKEKVEEVREETVKKLEDFQKPYRIHSREIEVEGELSELGEKYNKEVKEESEWKIKEDMVQEVKDKVFQRFIQSLERVETGVEKPEDNLEGELGEKNDGKVKEREIKEVNEIVSKVKDDMFLRFIQSVEDYEKKKSEIREFKKVQEKPYDAVSKGIQEVKGKLGEKHKEGPEGKIKEVQEIVNEVFQRFLLGKVIDIAEFERNINENREGKDEELDEVLDSPYVKVGREIQKVKEESGEKLKKQDEETKEVKDIVKEVKDEVFERFLQSVKKFKREREGKDKELKEVQEKTHDKVKEGYEEFKGEFADKLNETVKYKLEQEMQKLKKSIEEVDREYKIKVEELEKELDDEIFQQFLRSVKLFQENPDEKGTNQLEIVKREVVKIIKEKVEDKFDKKYIAKVKGENGATDGKVEEVAKISGFKYNLKQKSLKCAKTFFTWLKKLKEKTLKVNNITKKRVGLHDEVAHTKLIDHDVNKKYLEVEVKDEWKDKGQQERVEGELEGEIFKHRVEKFIEIDLRNNLETKEISEGEAVQEEKELYDINSETAKGKKAAVEGKVVEGTADKEKYKEEDPVEKNFQLNKAVFKEKGVDNKGNSDRESVKSEDKLDTGVNKTVKEKVEGPSAEDGKRVEGNVELRVIAEVKEANVAELNETIGQKLEHVKRVTEADDDGKVEAKKEKKGDIKQKGSKCANHFINKIQYTAKRAIDAIKIKFGMKDFIKLKEKKAEGEKDHPETVNEFEAKHHVRGDLKKKGLKCAKKVFVILKKIKEETKNTKDLVKKKVGLHDVVKVEEIDITLGEQSEKRAILGKVKIEENQRNVEEKDNILIFKGEKGVEIKETVEIRYEDVQGEIREIVAQLLDKVDKVVEKTVDEDVKETVEQVAKEDVQNEINEEVERKYQHKPVVQEELHREGEEVKEDLISVKQIIGEGHENFERKGEKVKVVKKGVTEIVKQGVKEGIQTKDEEDEQEVQKKLQLKEEEGKEKNGEFQNKGDDVKETVEVGNDLRREVQEDFERKGDKFKGKDAEISEEDIDEHKIFVQREAGGKLSMKGKYTDDEKDSEILQEKAKEFALKDEGNIKSNKNKGLLKWAHVILTPFKKLLEKTKRTFDKLKKNKILLKDGLSHNKSVESAVEGKSEWKGQELEEYGQVDAKEEAKDHSGEVFEDDVKKVFGTKRNEIQGQISQVIDVVERKDEVKVKVIDNIKENAEEKVDLKGEEFKEFKKEVRNDNQRHDEEVRGEAKEVEELRGEVKEELKQKAKGEVIGKIKEVGQEFEVVKNEVKETGRICEKDKERVPEEVKEGGSVEVEEFQDRDIPKDIEEVVNENVQNDIQKEDERRDVGEFNEVVQGKVLDVPAALKDDIQEEEESIVKQDVEEAMKGKILDKLLENMKDEDLEKNKEIKKDKKKDKAKNKKKDKTKGETNKPVKRKKPGSKENDWFIQQYEKFIGKRRKIETDPATVVGHLRMKAIARFTPEDLLYRPKPVLKESLFLSWEGPPVPKCGCPLRECFCTGEVVKKKNTCNRIIKESKAVFAYLCKWMPGVRGKSDAMDLYRRLEARLAAEVEVYREIESDGLR
ncbi:jg24207 [Pararge aegeria aegeria]|uniref:Jg24207 protein n=1 Tax=Pararge aegeria aegeria TaxID=348720 RepID=A0A8S4RTP3_9NEOP|nr:jg24207 [Pararge aegeria aegeria]